MLPVSVGRTALRTSPVAAWVAALLSALAPTAARAQAGFSEHAVGFGIAVSLPAAWAMMSDADMTATRERAIDRMRTSSVADLRAFAAANENTPIFHARDPRARANSANMNVTVNASVTPDTFAHMAAREVEALVAQVCGAFVAQAADAGGQAACVRHEMVTAAGRKVLVIYQDATLPRAGLDNRRTVAMIPAQGLLFTLSVSLLKKDADPAVSRAVLASLRFPPAL